MADRPILFSTPMVVAIVRGRKTQTRRVPTPQPETFLRADRTECEVALHYDEGDNRPRIRLGNVITVQRLRFGPGDRLWVREAWAKTSVAPIVETIDRPLTVYRAEDNRTDFGGPWKPGIHMRREDSRITLHVTDIRIHRLQEITPADAEAEGVFKHVAEHSLQKVFRDERGATAVKYFKQLWDGINGARFPWSDNPWVVALTFNVVLANIDTAAAVAIEPTLPFRGTAP